MQWKNICHSHRKLWNLNDIELSWIVAIALIICTIKSTSPWMQGSHEEHIPLIKPISSLWLRPSKESDCHCRRHKRHGFNPWVGKILGVGNGNPLRYSCLENSIDSGIWWVTIHGVAKSWAWLSDWSHVCAHTCTHTHTHTHTLIYTLVPSRDLAVSHQQSTLLKLGRVRLGTDGRNLSKRICIFCFSIPPKCIFGKFL